MIEVKFISHHRNAIFPKKSKETGFYYLYPLAWKMKTDHLFYETGISIDIPKGFYLEILPLDNIVERDLILPAPFIIKHNHKDTIQLRFKPVLRTSFVRDIDFTKIFC